MAYEVVMSYHLHMPSYFLGTFTEYPYILRQFLGKHAHIGYVAGTVLPRGMVGETKYLETAFDSAENIFFIASDGMHATCGMSVIVCFHCCVIISSIRMSNGSAGTSSTI